MIKSLVALIQLRDEPQIKMIVVGLFNICGPSVLGSIMSRLKLRLVEYHSHDLYCFVTAVREKKLTLNFLYFNFKNLL